MTDSNFQSDMTASGVAMMLGPLADLWETNPLWPLKFPHNFNEKNLNGQHEHFTSLIYRFPEQITDCAIHFVQTANIIVKNCNLLSRYHAVLYNCSWLKS